MPDILPFVLPRRDSTSTNVLGLATLAHAAFRGVDQRPLRDELLRRVASNPTDADALYDLSILHQLLGDRDRGLACQAAALKLQRSFVLQRSRTPHAPRLLAVVTTGDLAQNNALEFLSGFLDLQLEVVYTDTNLPLPTQLPEHDVLMVAICESDRNSAVLNALEQTLHRWRRPMLNRPAHVARLTREGACEIIRPRPGLQFPTTQRCCREALRQLVARSASPHVAGELSVTFPCILRPVDTHKGQGQEKIDSPSAIADYLQCWQASEYFVCPYIDYQSDDGCYRKYRVMLIDGKPELCHLAISEHWKVHYMSAGMIESTTNRSEEALAMRSFKYDFARRHERAFRSLAQDMGLEYVGIDCAEIPSGELLVFEVDSGMTIHAMDPPELFPYKGPQMQLVFNAFGRMVAKACERTVSIRRAA